MNYEGLIGGVVLGIGSKSESFSDGLDFATAVLSHNNISWRRFSKEPPTTGANPIRKIIIREKSSLFLPYMQ